MLTVKGGSCISCDDMYAHFEKLSSSYPDIKFATFDVSKNEFPLNYRYKYDLSKVPTFLHFKKGEITVYERNHNTINEMRQFLDRVTKKTEL